MMFFSSDLYLIWEKSKFDILNKIKSQKEKVNGDV